MKYIAILIICLSLTSCTYDVREEPSYPGSLRIENPRGDVTLFPIKMNVAQCIALVGDRKSALSCDWEKL